MMNHVFVFHIFLINMFLVQIALIHVIMNHTMCILPGFALVVPHLFICFSFRFVFENLLKPLLKTPHRISFFKILCFLYTFKTSRELVVRCNNNRLSVVKSQFHYFSVFTSNSSPCNFSWNYYSSFWIYTVSPKLFSFITLFNDF